MRIFLCRDIFTIFPFCIVFRKKVTSKNWIIQWMLSLLIQPEVIHLSSGLCILFYIFIEIIYKLKDFFSFPFRFTMNILVHFFWVPLKKVKLLRSCKFLLSLSLWTIHFWKCLYNLFWLFILLKLSISTVRYGTVRYGTVRYGTVRNVWISVPYFLVIFVMDLVKMESFVCIKEKNCYSVIVRYG